MFQMLFFHEYQTNWKWVVKSPATKQPVDANLHAWGLVQLSPIAIEFKPKNESLKYPKWVEYSMAELLREYKNTLWWIWANVGEMNRRLILSIQTSISYPQIGSSKQTPNNANASVTSYALFVRRIDAASLSDNESKWIIFCRNVLILEYPHEISAVIACSSKGGCALSVVVHLSPFFHIVIQQDFAIVS